MQFENYGQITSHLCESVISRLGERPDVRIDQGFSNVSCSAYVNVTLYELDDDGDQIEELDECKVRFSDHADHYGSDQSFNFNDLFPEDEINEFDEYEFTTIDDLDLNEMIKNAVTYVESFLRNVPAKSTHQRGIHNAGTL